MPILKRVNSGATTRARFMESTDRRPLSFDRDTIGPAIAREYGCGTAFYAGHSLSLPAMDAWPSPPAPSPARCGYRSRRLRRPSRIGVTIARETRREPWGLHEMHVTDPDGIAFIFMQIPETPSTAPRHSRLMPGK